MSQHIVYCDGACRGAGHGPTASGFVVYRDGEKVFEDAYVYPEPRTNNAAEYGALIMSLCWAVSNGVDDLLVRSDSQLVVRQMQGIYACKSELIALLDQALALSAHIKNFNIEWVRGHDGNFGNERADEICNMALDGKL